MSSDDFASNNKRRLHFGSLEHQLKAKKQRLNQDAEDVIESAASDNDGKGKVMLSEAMKRGMEAGNINISGQDSETMELSESSRAAIKSRQDILKQLEVKRRARAVMVPTNDTKVRERLRKLGHPICYFGEGAPERRERLRDLLANRLVQDEGAEEAKATAATAATAGDVSQQYNTAPTHTQAFLSEVSYGDVLRQARLEIANYSLPRAEARLARQRKEQESRPDDPIEAQTQDVKKYTTLKNKLKQLEGFGSEVADERPISGVSISADSKMLATCSWSGLAKVWSLPNALQTVTLSEGHDERITSIEFHPYAGLSQEPTEVNMATAGADRRINLWSLAEEEEEDSENSTKKKRKKKKKKSKSGPAVVTPMTTLIGHTERISEIAWHPSGTFLSSASYDQTWRLWDVEKEVCVLKQTGFSRPVFGIAINDDGSLVATGDLGGNARLWDLRSGKALLKLAGHCQQVLSIAFSPNGYHLATASDDPVVKLWDLRKRETFYTIPAHSKTISRVRYQPGNGAYLGSSSYDGTVKLWSTTTNLQLKALSGHTNGVMDFDICPDDSMIVSGSFDRTFKLWATDV